jgi:hypothetical protein
VAPGQAVPLPIVVTDHFTNRGWFGDGTITAHFKPGSTIIKETVATTGPCAARPAGAKGRCLQFSYTPPAGFAAPGTGAFVGLYMLTTMRATAGRLGEPNWGEEPGLPIVNGARRVTFWAASAEPGQRLSFRAGSAKDNVLLPEHSEVLSPTWQQFSMPFAGKQTGDRLVGGFAWTLKDTGRAATFYIDGVVWDDVGSDPPVAPMGNMNQTRELMVINKCAQTIWVGIGTQQVAPEGGGFQLNAGQTRTITMPGGKWSGRLWGRTGCVMEGGGLRCETGDCAGQVGCGGVGGKTPATLAEITYSGDAVNPDFYDLSLVDGYNLPMAMAPLPGSHGRNAGAPLDCAAPTCVSDLNATCPADLRVTVGGKVVGCLSACEKYNTDEFCCRGAFNQPETCPPFPASKTFKAACPASYSYAYDDSTSTFTCKGEDYAVWFCP